MRERAAHGVELPAQTGRLRAALCGRFLCPVAVRERALERGGVRRLFRRGGGAGVLRRAADRAGLPGHERAREDARLRVEIGAVLRAVVRQRRLRGLGRFLIFRLRGGERRFQLGALLPLRLQRRQLCTALRGRVLRVPGLRGILAQMRACGVTVLQDDWRVLRRGEDALIVAGTDDPCGPAERKTPAELIADIRAEAGEAAFLLLLAHRNDQLPQWSALGVQAVLAGHCHGGVVRLPFVGGLFGTDRWLFPAWDAGLYRQGETAMYVSRGLGYTNVHFRLFNRPEVAVIVLRRGSPAINP